MSHLDPCGSIPVCHGTPVEKCYVRPHVHEWPDQHQYLNCVTS